MAVIIGMDPHKRSATIEVINELGVRIGVGKFGTDQFGYAEMLTAGRRFTERMWAVEGCNGVGRHIAHRLVHDGETVLDVPAKLSAQVRVFATGNGRKTDPVDAHSVALAALRAPSLVRVQADPELVVMSMLVDHRDELGRARTQTVNRLHRLLLELFPGGAKKFLSATQARALVATTKPRDIVGKTRRRLTVELITELEAIDKKMTAADKDLRELVIARGSMLLDLHGIGPSGAARRGCWLTSVTSTASATGTGSRPGTAPHLWTLPQVNNNGIAYPALAIAESTGHCPSWESSNSATPPPAAAISTPRKPRARPQWKRCAHSNDASRTSSTHACSPTSTDARRQAREGQSGTTLQSSATGLTPDTGPSDKPQPGPATRQPTLTGAVP